ncbi:MAG TPA: protein-L-isoaspartate(D-aspartate) O-methyltransferase [Caldimonas sp.]|jgi:protein-L-isoaspartate(D-aspartate) O-methyltransferase|nr:protein-L-isoaspartate(D-aspartate) O-methyltransferase [Caldimonas sp.]HEX4234372.1 protein-L-isoaspartate(D-aspartate) O-methyltransferase [Caldimonas sp.]
MDEDDDITVQQREAMVAQQIASRGIRDPRLLDAIRRVPRHAFVAPAFRREAYDDTPLPIEAGQTISQPYIVALMLEAARLDANDRMLEIGAGSGYASAVAAQLVTHVDAIERHPRLVELARERLARLGVRNVDLHVGDGSAGWPQGAPYDAIIVAAAGPRVPPPLREQLAPGGRLVMPVDSGYAAQRLLLVTRGGDAAWQEDDLGGVMFVPLVGSEGWPERDRG